jgi:putative NADH-flavin reductase
MVRSLMNVLVIGASQGTGALCVRVALDKGHRVTAFSRSPQKLAIEHQYLRRLPGDFHHESSVQAAVKGHDAVIITAPATKLSAFRDNPNYFSQGTRYVVDAMKASGVKRLSVLSASGTGDSRALVNPLVRALLIGIILRTPFEDHDRQEQIIPPYFDFHR